MPEALRALSPGGASALAARASAREFLAFRLGADLYAVELTHVREIVSPPPLTGVPRARSEVIGICSVRGLLVTVLDVRRVLRLEPELPGRLARILLANAASGEVVGLFVDEVRQVIRLTPDEIELAAPNFGVELSRHVVGIGRPEGGFVVLLDLATLVDT